ncbi:TPA: transcriptional regulator, partial [Enterococcus faecalis]|nr:transcriptional regulator [Enterococcus faecalis]
MQSEATIMKQMEEIKQVSQLYKVL